MAPLTTPLEFANKYENTLKAVSEREQLLSQTRVVIDEAMRFDKQVAEQMEELKTTALEMIENLKHHHAVELQTVKDSAKTETDILKEEISDLKEEMSDLKEEMSDVKEESDLKEEMSDLKKEMSDLKEERKKLQEELAEKNKVIANMIGDDVKDVTTAWFAEVAKLHEAHEDALEEMKSAFKQKEIEYEKRIDDLLCATSPEAESELVSMKMKCAKMEGMLETTEKASLRWFEKWSALHIEYKSMESKMQGKESDLASKDDEITRKDDEIARKDDEIARKDDEIACKEQVIARNKGEIVRKRGANDRAQSLEKGFQMGWVHGVKTSLEWANCSIKGLAQFHGDVGPCLNQLLDDIKVPEPMVLPWASSTDPDLVSAIEMLQENQTRDANNVTNGSKFMWMYKGSTQAEADSWLEWWKTGPTGT